MPQNLGPVPPSIRFGPEPAIDMSNHQLEITEISLSPLGELHLCPCNTQFVYPMAGIRMARRPARPDPTLVPRSCIKRSATRATEGVGAGFTLLSLCTLFGYYLRVEQHAILVSLITGMCWLHLLHLPPLPGATSRVSTQHSSVPKSRNPEALPQLCTSRHVCREQTSECHLPRLAQPWPRSVCLPISASGLADIPL